MASTSHLDFRYANREEAQGPFKILLPYEVEGSNGYYSIEFLPSMKTQAMREFLPHAFSLDLRCNSLFKASATFVSLHFLLPSPQSIFLRTSSTFNI